MRYLFANVRIFDGAEPRLSGLTSLLVEDGLIKFIGEEGLEQTGGTRIDCAGATLMPGLIDCHIHAYGDSIAQAHPEPPATYRAQYANRFLREALECGFTSVRDMAGGDHGMAMALKAGFLDGPRFFYGGLALSQTGGHGDIRPVSQPSRLGCCGAEHNALAIVADGVDECTRAAREELRKGAHHIKIMASGGVLSSTGAVDRLQYSEAEIRSIVEECRRHGAYVCAHAHPSAAIRRCVEYGVRCIEHGTLIDPETAGYVSRQGAYIVPTLSVLFALLRDGERMGLDEHTLSKVRQVQSGALAGLRIMKAAGVKMGFGTDLLGEHRVHRGDEFRLRREVLEPFDILHSATAVNAEILQMQGRLGVIRAGACADFLVLDGNPLSDLELLAEGGRHLKYIVADGRIARRPV